MNIDKIKSTGLEGEKQARDYLISNHYKILASNYHSPYGEIDIIAIDNTTLVFIEVKTRSSHLDDALNSISVSKRKKIAKTASYYLSKNPQYEDMFTRFDVIAIITHQNVISLKHIKEAFTISY